MVLCLLYLPLKALYKLGMENANRLQPRPWKIRGPVQGAIPPSGDMEVPNVPKQPRKRRNLTNNIN